VNDQSQQQPLLPAEQLFASPVSVSLLKLGIAQVISIAFRLPGHFGYVIEIANLDVDAIAADAAQLVAFGFGVWAFIQRKRSKVQPLTFTQAGADALTKSNPPILPSNPTVTTKEK
jgi:hypothetical protein